MFVGVGDVEDKVDLGDKVVICSERRKTRLCICIGKRNLVMFANVDKFFLGVSFF
jgi:hypothetical protein